MVTVSTPTQLQQAIESRENEIIITGEMVQNFRNHKKARLVLIIVSIALLVFGLFGSPLTNGYSMIGGAFGIILCIGTFAFKSLPIAVPFAMYTAGAKNALKMIKSGKAWINPDGTVAARLRYK